MTTSPTASPFAQPSPLGDLAAAAARAEQSRRRTILAGAIFLGFIFSGVMIGFGLAQSSGSVAMVALCAAGGVGLVVATVGFAVVFSLWRPATAVSNNAELREQLDHLS